MNQAPAVRKVTVDASRDGQRLDNFLSRYLDGVPKAAIYRLIRTGQVRVNGGRAKPMHKLSSGDEVRIPPVRTETPDEVHISPELVSLLQGRVLYDDGRLLVLDKPAGLAVHGGSGLAFGVIDIARQAWPGQDLELAHRIDRETSGCLLLARGRNNLNRVQDALRSRELKKSYLALLQGHLPEAVVTVELPLERLAGKGDRPVVVDMEQGKPAHSVFRRLESVGEADYCQVDIRTGRTHQIRVHAQSLGQPLAGDSRYGDREWNKRLRARGLKRLFLHAHTLELPLEDGGSELVNAPLPDDLRGLLDQLGGVAGD